MFCVGLKLYYCYVSEFIQAVNLPSTSEIGNTLEGDTFTVSGWGLTTDGNSVTLRELKVH